MFLQNTIETLRRRLDSFVTLCIKHKFWSIIFFDFPQRTKDDIRKATVSFSKQIHQSFLHLLEFWVVLHLPSLHNDPRCREGFHPRMCTRWRGLDCVYLLFLVGF